MPVDQDLLRSLSSFEDPRAGFGERFLTPSLAGVRTVAVLGMPVTGVPIMGWLLCSSFGPEQDALTGWDVSMARAMARAGFAVLRYHGSGYGDSQRADEDAPDPKTHVDDAVAAARVLREASGSTSIGVLGARFGATVALLAAQRAGADRLALVEPVVDGAAYLRSLAIRSRVSALEGAGRATAPSDEAGSTPPSGDVEIDGFLIRESQTDAFARLDVLGAAKAFQGTSLLLRVARRGEPDGQSSDLADALGRGSGRCQVETVVHPDAHRLGLPRFRKVAAVAAPGQPRRPRRTDVQVDLTQRTTEPVVEWSTAQR